MRRGALAATLAVLLALALQVAIGINMVLRGFPLELATAHNAGAALLLSATLALNHALHPITHEPHRRQTLRTHATGATTSS